MDFRETEVFKISSKILTRVGKLELPFTEVGEKCRKKMMWGRWSVKSLLVKIEICRYLKWE